MAMSPEDGRAEHDRLLLEAVEQQDLAAVQQQLAAGADASGTTSQGRTPLYVAVANPNEQIVAALLAAGADAASLPDDGVTPLLFLAEQLHRRARACRVEYCACGLRFGPGPCKHMHQCSPSCGQAAGVVQQLVAAGTGVDTAAGYGRAYTPLHHAAEAGCPTLVAALLQAGADPGSTTAAGYTMLHAAASSGNLEVMQQVLGALGSSRAAEMVNMLGQGPPACFYPPASAPCTPLHLAVWTGQAGVVQALVAVGADLEQRHTVGAALHMALAQSYFHLVPLLVTPRNANQCSTARGYRNCSPLCRVAEGEGYSGVYPSHRWATESAKAAAALLAAGADSSATGDKGRAPVEAAAGRGHAEVLQVLLEHEMMQQQQAGCSKQPSPALLQRLGANALAGGNGPTWRLLLTLAADALGQEGVRRLWAGLKQQLQQFDLKTPGTEGQVPEDRPEHVLDAWFECWADACKAVAAQRTGIVQRLQQLVIDPYHQQQQQQQESSAGAGVAGKRLSSTSTTAAAPAAPAATDEEVQPTLPDGGSSIGASGSSSSKAVRAESKAAEARQLKVIEAAAANGDEPGVRAALLELPDRPSRPVKQEGLHRSEGQLAAAVAAGATGHWGLCMGLLRERVMLEEYMNFILAKKAVHQIRLAIYYELIPQQQQHQQQQEEEQHQQQQEAEEEEEEGQEEQPLRKQLQHLQFMMREYGWEMDDEEEEFDEDDEERSWEDEVKAEEEATSRRQKRAVGQLQVALKVCDALVTDWLALQQQRVRELREAVVAAAEAAVSATSAATQPAAAIAAASNV